LSLVGNAAKQMNLNIHIIVPDAPVPTKNIPINSPPNVPAILIAEFCCKLLNKPTKNIRTNEK